MKKKIAPMVVVLSVALLISGWKGKPGGCLPPECDEVCQAIQDLESDDYVVVRHALYFLNRNLDASGISKAIDPLILLCQDANGRRDTYTRTLAVPVLLRIGIKKHRSFHGREAIAEIIRLLRESHSDMVRASCASALGVNGQTQAIPDLEAALQTDPSIFVQTQACRALLRLTDGSYQSDNCGYEQEAVASASGSPNVSGWVQPSSLGSETMDPDQLEKAKQWYKSHILLPLPEELDN